MNIFSHFLILSLPLPLRLPSSGVAAAVAAAAGPDDVDACRLEGALVCRGDRVIGVQVRGRTLVRRGPSHFHVMCVLMCGGGRVI